MHDDVDGVDVKPAGCHVSGHENVQLPGSEVGQRPLALLLTEVAVDGTCVDAELLELVDHFVSTPLGPTEDQGLVVGGHNGRGHFHLVHLVDVEVVLNHAVNRLGVALDLVEDGVGQIARDQAIHRSVQGGREQQRLVGALQTTQHPLDLGHEAHVCHPVRLVENEDVELVNTKLTTITEVDQAAWSGDNELTSLAQLRDLALNVGAAVDGGHPHTD